METGTPGADGGRVGTRVATEKLARQQAPWPALMQAAKAGIQVLRLDGEALMETVVDSEFVWCLSLSCGSCTGPRGSTPARLRSASSG